MRNVRLKIVRKMKTAVNMIAVRGADVTVSKLRWTLVCSGVDDQTQWILHGRFWLCSLHYHSLISTNVGWSYIFFPTIHVYRMPYHELIPQLRIALQRLYQEGSEMEKRWAAKVSLSDRSSALSPHNKEATMGMETSTLSAKAVRRVFASHSLWLTCITIGPSC